jgi:hypothetical protein
MNYGRYPYLKYHQPHNLMEVSSSRKKTMDNYELMDLGKQQHWVDFSTLSDPLLYCFPVQEHWVEFTTLGDPMLSCAGTLGRYFTTLGHPVLSFDSSFCSFKNCYQYMS